MTSAKRADIGKDVIKLTDTEAAKFKLAIQRRGAIMEAGETMARNFAQQMDEAMQGLQEAYVSCGEHYKLDLTTHRYEFDERTNSLILTQVAVQGTLR